MAGVLGQLIRPQKKAMHRSSRADRKVLALVAAKEILAEVFRVRISDVEEMIQNRFEAHCEEPRHEEDGLWAREFWQEEEE